MPCGVVRIVSVSDVMPNVVTYIGSDVMADVVAVSVVSAKETKNNKPPAEDGAEDIGGEHLFGRRTRILLQKCITENPSSGLHSPTLSDSPSA